jgi:hypothetical protein
LSAFAIWTSSAIGFCFSSRRCIDQGLRRVQARGRVPWCDPSEDARARFWGMSGMGPVRLVFRRGSRAAWSGRLSYS